jgi:hypothetical protein
MAQASSDSSLRSELSGQAVCAFSARRPSVPAAAHLIAKYGGSHQRALLAAAGPAME